MPKTWTPDNQQIMQEIVNEARELLDYAEAGGSDQYAYEVCADTQVLANIHQKLIDFGTDIRSELSTPE